MLSLSSYWWVDDLLRTDASAMGVYLALLYMRIWKDVTFSSTPDGLEVLREINAVKLYAKYFAGRGTEIADARDAGKAFIDKLFIYHGNALDWKTRRDILGQIEARFFDRFVRSFKKYLRLDQIEDRDIVFDVLRGLQSGAYPAEPLTVAGTIKIRNSDLVDALCRFFNVKNAKAEEIIAMLLRSGLAIEYYGSCIFPALVFSDKIMELIKGKPVTLESLVPPPPPSDYARLKPDPKVLENIVAEVLSNLGFQVSTRAHIRARRGGPIEVDVWGRKRVSDMDFFIYVSCKNWSSKVGRPVVNEEVGRIMDLITIPQLRVLVAKELTEDAKEAAKANGFLVIELGEQAHAENSTIIYEKIHTALNELFIGMAPPRLLEVAARINRISKDLEKIAKELSELTTS